MSPSSMSSWRRTHASNLSGIGACWTIDDATRSNLPINLGHILIVVLLCLLTSNAWGQETNNKKQALSTLQLAPIVVQSSRLNQSVLNTPAAITVLDASRALRAQPKTQIEDPLNSIPGVYATNGNNYVQGLGVSIRGFGARAPYGIRGIRIRVDGIPASTVDGGAATDSIDPAAISSIEVRRGPFSVQYGNASGGIINITTLSPSDGPLNQVEVAFGANDYRRYILKSAHDYGNWGFATTASHLHVDNFRQQSSAEINRFTGKLTRDIGKTGELMLTTRLLEAPESLDPGGITLQRAKRDRDAADPANLKYDARQDVSQQTFGLVYTDQLNGQTEYRLTSFYSHRDFIEFLPYSGKSGTGAIPKVETNYFGGGAQIRRHSALWGHDNQFVVGLDVRAQLDQRKRFVNQLGDRGELRQNEDQHAITYGIYAQNKFAVTPKLHITAGLRYDRLHFEIDDHYITPTNGDASGSQSYDQVSASGGIIYRFAEMQRVYANIATSYQTPTFGEFANPSGNGGFNPSLEPQHSINYEVGVKGLLGSRGRYQFDVFWIEVDDAIANYKTGTVRDFYTNVGGSTRKGIEASLRYRLPGNLWVQAAYTLASYEFDNFRNKNGSFDGNRIPGIPEQTANLAVGWRKADVGFAKINARYIGSVYADNANTTRVSDYTVVDARLGKMLIAGTPGLTLYGGVNNIFDTEYFDNIRINARNAEYYEPAPGRTWYAGVKLIF